MKIPTPAFLILATLALAIPASAQIATGSSPGQQALAEATSQVATASRPRADFRPTGQAGKTTVTSSEPSDKWWLVNASTGWDSLYMFRGVNVLGNGNGIYWLGGDITVEPWTDGALSAGLWYGLGTHWNGANEGSGYGQMNVFADYTHSFGNLDLTAGWIYYWFPTLSRSANEIFFGASYAIEVGSVTITPNTTYYYNVGPQLFSPGGIVPGGASWWEMGVNAEIPVAYDGAVALAPHTRFGVNFNYNPRFDGNFFRGGNNWETGVALPIQFTRWFSVSPYIAYSYQWQNLIAGPGTGTFQTAVNTWWCGISANFSY